MNITANTANNLSDARELYLSAFPKYERLPWWVLRLFTLNKNANLTCYYANGEFCGFTFDVITDSILYLMFFAVKRELRGKGCGSAILKYLKENNPSRAITLNVEIIDPSAENAEERVKRVEFYKKNGCVMTGVKCLLYGVDFNIMLRPISSSCLSDKDTLTELEKIYHTMFDIELYKRVCHPSIPG